MELGARIATVAQCWRYPVKSMQGATAPRLRIGTHGVAADRAHALVDDSEHVLSAKSVPELLWAAADDQAIHLPDGSTVGLDDEDRDERLSQWLGRAVRLLSLEQSHPPSELGLSYEMTFDPPDDDAELFEIPLPEHGFVDLAPLHVLAASTLEGCRRARPELDWDVRRFRPNLVLEDTGADGDTPTEDESGAGVRFVEDRWVGAELAVGESCVLRVQQPTVRCAMPLRAQPASAAGPELSRRRELYRAMTELHPEVPNHLGVYVEVVSPGEVALGDPVVVSSLPDGGA
jgi:uncharacterized protein YcbX